MSDVAIEVNHLWKKFHRGELHDSLRDLIPAVTKRLLGRGPRREELAQDDFWALKDVHFQLARGQALGIVGANGAGKSTLFKVLAKILRPNRGSVRVHGRLRALIEVAAGFHGDLTGRENVYLNGTILGMKKREIDAKFEQIVEFSGIRPFIDMPVKRYSSGMYARLGFAVAAHLDPDILLVDEILSVGDAAFQVKCQNHMQSLTKSGATVVFVSHNMGAVADLCSEAILLRSGEILQRGPCDEVITAYKQSTLAAGNVDEAIEVLGFELRDLEGNEVISLQSGQRYEGHFRFRVQREMADCAIAMGVVTRMHHMIFDTSTIRLGCAPHTYQPGDVEHYVFQFDANLATGCYGLVFRLMRYNPTRIYWERDPMIFVDVLGQPGTGGAVYLDFAPLNGSVVTTAPSQEDA